MAPDNPALKTLLERPDLWRLDDRAPRGLSRGLESGYVALDQLLHQGGWPRATLTELLSGRPGFGELQLLAPVLAQLSREKLWQVWINPPFVPYAPALASAGIGPESLLIVRTEPKQQLWACEQALRCAANGAVLYWPAQPLRYAELRKLQVAAAAQQSLAFLFRHTSVAAHTSPAALRLQVAIANQQMSVEILKQRGGRSGQQVLLPLPVSLREQLPLAQRIWPPLEDTLHDNPRLTRRAIDPLAARRSVSPTVIARSEGRVVH